MLIRKRFKEKLTPGAPQRKRCREVVVVVLVLERRGGGVIKKRDRDGDKHLHIRRCNSCECFERICELPQWFHGELRRRKDQEERNKSF